ncbi:hypothetical protein B0I31_113171 [Saccharothrix carnea]|uniref:Ig-like domain-containing protein n=1 Tax=Saccharothrix carnea TaxID=1280637 RepID=A0A2P8I213_SACCR|nr:hypothetical protein [Saccharothrix carnea]PSL52498.1 hypothetical protein B0I31_113171 [Saccharothrix carnea]
MIKSLRTFVATLMTLVSALALLVLGPAGTASAGVLDVTCTPPSSNSITYNPPLTRTPQDVTIGVSAQYGPCVSLSNPALTSGHRAISVLSPGFSCLELLNSGSVTFTITWNTGQTSTVSANYSATVVGAALVDVRTGTVTSGLFAGSTVLQTTTGPATDVLLCTAGLGTVSGIYSLVTLEITSL